MVKISAFSDQFCLLNLKLFSHFFSAKQSKVEHHTLEKQ